MKFISFLQGGQARLAVVDGDQAIDLNAAQPQVPADLRQALSSGVDLIAAARSALAGAPRLPLASLKLAPVVPEPGKTVCLGLNYFDHAKEGGREKPDYPWFFLRGTSSLMAHGDTGRVPKVSPRFDYEAELAVVIGTRVPRHTPRNEALRYVFGYACFNDMSVRDYQKRTPQWTIGKNFDATGGFGPWLVTADELPPGAAGLRIQGRLNGAVMQDASTSDMIFDVAETIELLAAVLTLEPGDVIAMGTPAGVGQARTPPVWMKQGDVFEVEIEGIGRLVNPIADEAGLNVDAVYDVAIVGFGPSGAVAAALCAQAGLKTFVCDKAAGVYDKPRAIALDHEIMRVFQQLGLADAIAPWVEPFTPSEYFGVDGRLIKRMTMVAPPYPLGHTPSMVFSQPPVERSLRQHVAAQPGVTVALGLALAQMTQDDSGVTLTLQTHAAGQGAPVAGSAPQTVRARYLIGCDGASSTVRTLLGIPLEDLEFDEPWLVVDVLVNARGLAKLPTTSVQYCEPDRPCTMVIGTRNHRRWEISLRPGEDLEAVVTPEATWALLSRWLTPEDGELWRQASYRFHALVASRWRVGRSFIAGDAAHQQPPFLGQGMCQGVRDVANLVWKLAAVVKGEARGAAARALLDSYGTERQAHVRELTRRIKAIGAVICERDIDKARARDAALLADCGGVVKDTPRQDVLPRLEHGCLSARPSSARGSIFPQPRVGVGTEAALLDELTGHGWRLVVDDGLAGIGPLRHGLSIWHLGAAGWVETDGIVAAWMQRHACHAALVRPDGCVFGSAATRAELDGLLSEHAAVLGL